MFDYYISNEKILIEITFELKLYSTIFYSVAFNIYFLTLITRYILKFKIKYCGTNQVTEIPIKLWKGKTSSLYLI